MANIVYDSGVDIIHGSRQGLTFDVSQAGQYVKKRPSPINHQTNPRMLLRRNLKAANEFYWNLTGVQKNLWAAFGVASGITGPYGMTGSMQGNAAFFTCAIVANDAGDGFPTVPGLPNPIAGVTFTALTWIDKDTVRATFNPSAPGVTLRVYLRQGLPGPGVRRWSAADGYIGQYSAVNPNSTLDLTTKFQHRAGWHGRYWLGTQNTSGGRSTETLFDL